MALATTGWTTPAVTTTGERWDAARYNELIDNDREFGSAWRTFTPAVVWSGSGSDGNAGSSTVTGGYLLTDHLLTVRCRLVVNTGGAWAQGTNQWGFDLSSLIDGVTWPQAGAACWVDGNGKPLGLGAVLTTGMELITEATGGAMPATPATGHLLLASGTFEHDG